MERERKKKATERVRRDMAREEEGEEGGRAEKEWEGGGGGRGEGEGGSRPEL